MVYGVLRMINFAHGEMFMLGAYAAFALLAVFAPGLGNAGALLITVVFFASVVSVGLCGVEIERVA